VRGGIKWIARISTTRGAWIALALTGLLLEATALYFQYGLDLKPCVMCIYIRLATLGIVLAGVIGAIAPAKAPVQVLGFAIWAVAALEGVSLSRELIAIQQAGPYSLEVTCAFLPDFPTWLPLHEWLPGLLMPTGTCTDDIWTWLGLSMAQWLRGIFIVYLVVLAVVVACRLSARAARIGLQSATDV
jgi:protein dithiol:quinone oxidoreductase